MASPPPSSGVVFERGGNTAAALLPASTVGNNHLRRPADLGSSDLKHVPKDNEASNEFTCDHKDLSLKQYNGSYQEIPVKQGSIISPPPGLISGSFPPPLIDTSMPPPLFPHHPFHNPHYNQPILSSFNPFRPPPSLPHHQPVIGSYPSLHTDSMPQNSPPLSMSVPSTSTNAINIPRRAIPHHMVNDPTVVVNHGESGSSAPNSAAIRKQPDL